MKKGEMKKLDFLRTAEIRFCRDGYEQTSIQEILDDLQTSKGSFYHHFASKESLLEEICKNHAVSTSDLVFMNMIPEMKPDEKLNMLITSIIPFTGEKLNFLLMLIPVFSKPEGVSIRNCYEKELERLYLSPVTETLQSGTEQNYFACKDPGFSARILILLINRFWAELCDRVFENETKGVNTDPAELMTITMNYRTAAERLLSAPYGSVDIIQLREIHTLINQIHLHWKR